ISYVLPLTYFTEISRGVMLRAEPLGPLWQPMLYLALLGLAAGTLATLRFRSFLAPAGHRRGGARPPAPAPPVTAGAGSPGSSRTGSPGPARTGAHGLESPAG